VNYSLLILAIFWQESRHNPTAYNAKENAYGIAQIRQACLTDVNEYAGTHYTLADFTGPAGPERSAWAIATYARRNGFKSDEEIARLWGAGRRRMYGPGGDWYWRKVREYMATKPWER
jgi:soluble lytic murein transglycosylase-like protein